MDSGIKAVSYEERVNTSGHSSIVENTAEQRDKLKETYQIEYMKLVRIQMLVMESIHNISYYNSDAEFEKAGTNLFKNLFSNDNIKMGKYEKQLIDHITSYLRSAEIEI